MFSSVRRAEKRKQALIILVRRECGVFRPSRTLRRRMVEQTAARLLWLITFGLCLPNRALAAAPDAFPQTLRVEARDLNTDAPVKGVLFKLSVAGGKKIEASSDAEGIARFEYTFPEETGQHSFFRLFSQLSG